MSKLGYVFYCSDCAAILAPLQSVKDRHIKNTGHVDFDFIERSNAETRQAMLAQPAPERHDTKMGG